MPERIFLIIVPWLSTFAAWAVFNAFLNRDIKKKCKSIELCCIATREEKYRYLIGTALKSVLPATIIVSLIYTGLMLSAGMRPAPIFYLVIFALCYRGAIPGDGCGRFFSGISISLVFAVATVLGFIENEGNRVYTAILVYGIMVLILGIITHIKYRNHIKHGDLEFGLGVYP